MPQYILRFKLYQLIWDRWALGWLIFLYFEGLMDCSTKCWPLLEHKCFIFDFDQYYLTISRRPQDPTTRLPGLDTGVRQLDNWQMCWRNLDTNFDCLDSDWTAENWTLIWDLDANYEPSTMTAIKDTKSEQPVPQRVQLLWWVENITIFCNLISISYAILVFFNT